MAYGWGWDEKRVNETDIEIVLKTWKGKMDEFERFQKQEWERTRVLGAWIMNSQGSKITAVKLLPLPWDKKLTKETFLQENKELIPVWDKLSKNE